MVHLTPAVNCSNCGAPRDDPRNLCSFCHLMVMGASQVGWPRERALALARHVSADPELRGFDQVIRRASDAVMIPTVEPPSLN